MNEAQWLSSTDPQVMLEHYTLSLHPFPQPGPSDRKLRLFACAWWSMFQPHEEVHCNRAQDVEHGYRDWQSMLDDCKRDPDCGGDWLRQWDALAPTAAALLRDVFGNPFRPLAVWDRRRGQPEYGCWIPTVLSLAQAAYEERLVEKCGRCGGKGRLTVTDEEQLRQDRSRHKYTMLPPRKKLKCPTCHGTGTTPTAHLDPDRVAVLADALEEAGCTEDGLLGHLRGPGPHVRGCWALDLVLGKE